MLTDPQREELHSSIVDYLRGRCDPGLANAVGEALGVGDLSAESTSDALLERKWAALVRMQRKILDLEAANAQLQTDLKAARSAPAEGAGAASGSVANYLPRAPPKFVLEGHRGRVACVALHPKYALLASGCEDGSVKIWDYEQGELERTLKAHTRAVHGACFAPLSGELVTCSADLSVKVWTDFANTRTLLGHDHTVSCVAVGAVGMKEYVFSGSRDKTVRVWELSTGFLVDVLRMHSDWVRSVDTMQVGDTPYILSAGSDRVVMLRRWGDSSDECRQYAAHRHVIECCKFAPPSSHRFIARQYPALAETDLCFASAGRDNVIYVWTSSADRPIMTLTGHDNWVQGLAFHPSGRFLVSVADDKTMRIWDLANARLAKTLPAHDHFVSCVAWHNKTVATGSVDQSVRVW